MIIITRQQAKNEGLSRYYTGKPCPHGHISERLVASKSCRTCNLNSQRMSYRKKPEQYQAKTQQWRDTHPDQTKVMSRRAALKWMRSHPEQVKANVARWRMENPDKHRAHGEKWRKANPDIVHKMTMRWRKANPDKHKANWTRRRAWKLNAPGTFTNDDLALMLERQHYRCVGCHTDLSKSYTIDHITPLSRGGSNWPNNLQLLCFSCNSSKQDKTMTEWKPSIATRP